MPIDCIQAFRDNSAETTIQKAAFRCAREKAEQIFARSNIKDNTNAYPMFTIDEIKLGKTLGKGNFGIAYECLGFSPMECHTFREETSSWSLTSDTASMSCNEAVNANDEKSRSSISEHCIREGGSARYALKMLQHDTINQPGMLIRGSIDMALESRILSSILHPNIIRMHACGATSPFNYDYFIVIDKLYDTLDRRIEKWGKKQMFVNSTLLGFKIFDRKGKRRSALLEDKIVTAVDLAAAFEYLHSKNIVFRDLKPANVGFDFCDDVKLFDFGLAKELHNEDRDADGLFKLTAMTGSPLYMAPEVAMGLPYDSSCDVYSFAVMFWHMYTCKEPFLLYGMKDMRERVWSGEHKRPKISESCPPFIAGLLYDAWSQDVKKRPPFQQISKFLEECIRVADEYDPSVDLLQR